jgi:Zn ribbon nucleic-acid-binding protein
MKKYWYISEYKVKDKFEKIIFCEKENLPQWSSCSGPYDSEEELRQKREIADFVCSKCGGLVSLNYTNADDLKKHKLCFKCDHFRQVKEKAETNKNRVIIEGNSYHVEPDNPGAYFKGFGGHEFKIVRNDAPETVITTRNLWHQGEIPEIWKEDIPNNAKFVK